MSAIKGRPRRPLQEPGVVVQARVSPETRAKAHKTAAALNVSLTAYVERLIAHDQLDESGRPVWWPKDEQEELSLSRSA